MQRPGGEPPAGFFSSLHPAALLSYLGVMVTAAIVVGHPLVLLFLLALVLALLTLAGRAGPGLKYSRGLLALALPLVLINTLVNDLGDTLLWRGPWLWGWGQVNVTAENLVFSLSMVLRLAVTLLAFTFFNLVMDVDRALRAVTRIFPRSGLLVILATRTMPQLVTDVERIAQVQRCRGVDGASGGWLERLRRQGPLLRVLVTSSLEGSFTLAESMQARAYGSGRRTSYRQEGLRPRDGLLLAVAGLGGGGLALAGWRGWLSYTYYPRLESLVPAGAAGHVLLGLALMSTLPLWLAWGWNRWPWLRWMV